MQTNINNSFLSKVINTADCKQTVVQKTRPLYVKKVTQNSYYESC